VIILSSLANERIDDDISRHIGLNGQGAHILHELFRSSPTHPVVPIATGLLFAFAGTIAVVACLQQTYEKVFGQEPRGWRDFPRFLTWVAALLGALVSESIAGRHVRDLGGIPLYAGVSLAVLTLFFGWTMHFLLAGRVPWRAVVRPAFVTALLWLGLAGFSAAYFSSAVVSDSRLYGTIGVVFSLLTWFIAIGAIIVLGAVVGVVWQERADSRPSSGRR
jgi:membrane protein